MNLTKRVSVLTATTALLLGAVGAGSASAADVSTRAVHRGSAGCINWSWGDGTISWTVYASNTCGTSRGLAFRSTGGAIACIWMGARSQEHHTYPAKPDSDSFTNVAQCPVGTGD
ncbi:hypothetical protein DF268_38745 [Streptomyces sp. V2]|uniref:hypothetical protein n=1 Tax=Streptomyces TaxID=1883 RepID=UPI0006EB5C6B|nr:MULTISPECIES: hypothetical protein [Streptomyces]PWG08241.1 hypothetical protein DF268_38745 [Streptomyces sp. V2]